MKLSFTPLDKLYYPTISPYFSLRPTACSESQLLYHIIWENYYQTKFCILPTGILWVQKVDNYQHAALFPISKKDNLKDIFYLLQEHFTHSLNSKLVLFLVDEEALEAINPDESKYDIIEDVDSFDYIYDANQLKLLAGKKYHKKKNHINGFLKEYGNRYEYKRLTAKDSEDILEFSHQWLLSKDSEDEFNRLECEEIGLKNMLECSFLSDVNMGGIYIDGKLEAFTLGNYNSHKQMAIIHIEKANHQFRGLYPFINQQFLIHEFPNAVYVNREDDMGIPSLRKAKEAYNPIQMAKKYTIYEK